VSVGDVLGVLEHRNCTYGGGNQPAKESLPVATFSHLNVRTKVHVWCILYFQKVLVWFHTAIMRAY